MPETLGRTLVWQNPPTVDGNGTIAPLSLPAAVFAIPVCLYKLCTWVSPVRPVFAVFCDSACYNPVLIMVYDRS